MILADRLRTLGYQHATRAGISICVDDMRDPARQGALHRRRARAGGRGPRAVPGRSDQRRRALQQGDRHLGRRDRADRRPAARQPRHGHSRRTPTETTGARAELQLHLHDGRLGRARVRAADPPARRHARPDGEAVGRDHRDADHVELPRRALGAPVLHLDARRAQGSGRHGAQDRQLRLPDAPSGRRRAGHDHPRGGLRRRAEGIEIGAAGRGRRDHRAASASASSAAWRSTT